jgi:environmental stress-induced protein Ves
VSGAGAATRVALSDRRRRVGVGEFLSPPDIERLLCALADGGLPLRRAGPRRQLRP